jgi:hypothetical protein
MPGPCRGPLAASGELTLPCTCSTGTACRPGLGHGASPQRIVSCQGGRTSLFAPVCALTTRSENSRRLSARDLCSLPTRRSPQLLNRILTPKKICFRFKRNSSRSPGHRFQLALPLAGRSAFRTCLRFGYVHRRSGCDSARWRSRLHAARHRGATPCDLQPSPGTLARRCACDRHATGRKSSAYAGAPGQVTEPAPWTEASACSNLSKDCGCGCAGASGHAAAAERRTTGHARAAAARAHRRACGARCSPGQAAAHRSRRPGQWRVRQGGCRSPAAGQLCGSNCGWSNPGSRKRPRTSNR